LEIVAKNLEPYKYNQYDILDKLQRLNYSLMTISGTCVDKNNIDKYMKMYEEFLAIPTEQV
jgi:hypothetical protein